MRKILCPIEMNEKSARCITLASEIARCTSSKLVSLYVIPYEEISTLPHIAPSMIEKVLDEKKDEAKKFLSKWDGEFIEKGVLYEKEIRKGTPYYKIFEVAKEKRVFLIVITPSSVEEFEDLILGSTTSRVIRHSDVDVLLVRGDIPTKIDKILVPVDLSEHSVKCFERAIIIGKFFKSEIIALYVLTSGELKLPVEIVKELEQAGKSAMKKRLTKVIERYSKEKINLEVETDGDVSSVINRYAKKNNIDMIMVSTHSRHSPFSLPVGKITERIIKTSPCPVWLVPKPESKLKF